MTNLTEKWKNKELEQSFYYLRTSDDRVIVAKTCFIGDKIAFDNYYAPKFIKEVIAPVPSYEELQALKQKIHILTESQMKLESTIGELGEENARLKEKINNISKQTKTLREKVMLWKNGLFCTTEKSALFYVEKGLTNIEEALK